MTSVDSTKLIEWQVNESKTHESAETQTSRSVRNWWELFVRFVFVVFVHFVVTVVFNYHLTAHPIASHSRNLNRRRLLTCAMCTPHHQYGRVGGWLYSLFTLFKSIASLSLFLPIFAFYSLRVNFQSAFQFTLAHRNGNEIPSHHNVLSHCIKS